MTTPGGVPNLPMGALTLDTLAEKLHDMSPTAMRGRAAERMPSIFNSSMGGNPMSDFSFLGLMTQLFAGFNSAISNADPADVTGPDDLPSLLIDFIEELPVIGELITLIESIMNGEFDPAEMVTSVENMFETLGSMLFGADFDLDAVFGPIHALVDMFDFSSPEAFIGSLINALLALPAILLNLAGGLVSGGGLLGGDSPLDAFNLFGSIPGGLVDLVPFSHIGSSAPNLLTAPGFDSAANMSGVAPWTWDGTVGRTTTPIGSATVTANGTNLKLLSNMIAVTEGQTLDVGVWTKWSGLVFTGTPIRLRMARYLDGAEVGVDDVAAPVSPGTDQSSWLQLSDTYTVPAGCDHVCLYPHVAATATAGQVWFDDATTSKTGTMRQSWIENLTGDLDGLGENITNGLSDLGKGIFDGWFGSGGGTDPPAVEAQTTIEAIKQAVISGYTVDTFTSSGTWTKPAGIVELTVIAIPGGQNGSAGLTDKTLSLVAGGAGGAGVGYVAQQLDPDSVAGSVTVTVGTAGNATSFGGYLTVSPGGSGGIATTFGYTATSSTPGTGGAGGSAMGGSSRVGNAGTVGEASAIAAGGTAGAGAIGTSNTTASNGGAGGAVSAGVLVKCGGGGGGGGGGCGVTNATANGGDGGAGGYPGGAGGGGGAAASTSIGITNAGSGGAGATGCLWVFYR